MNSVILTSNAKFMTMDIKNFYLIIPSKWYEYLRLKIDAIPEDVQKQYELQKKVTGERWVYSEIQKGMYGLPLAGLLAQELLEQQLARNGYTQSKLTPVNHNHEAEMGGFFLIKHHHLSTPKQCNP